MSMAERSLGVVTADACRVIGQLLDGALLKETRTVRTIVAEVVRDRPALAEEILAGLAELNVVSIRRIATLRDEDPEREVRNYLHTLASAEAKYRKAAK